MTKLNTGGLDAKLIRAAAYYATIEELEAGIGRAQSLLEGLTPGQASRALSGVVADLQSIRAHHYEVASG